MILLGSPGVGKTHLAIGLAMKALEAGTVVYYASLAHLIADLKMASEQSRLEKRWRVYLRPDILIIYEVSYLQLNRQKAELLFRLISERYECGNIILTSNKYFSDWGELMSDTVIATAMPDRLLAGQCGLRRLLWPFEKRDVQWQVVDEDKHKRFHR